MKKTTLSAAIGTAIAAAAISAVVPASASAASFSNSYNGSDRTDGGITYLNYGAGHATFTLRLNVDGWANDEAYWINMYNASGQQVFGTFVQGQSLITGRAADQLYAVGGNVTRVRVDPRSWTSLVKWSRA